MQSHTVLEFSSLILLLFWKMRCSAIQRFSQRGIRKAFSTTIAGVQRDSACHLKNRFRILNHPYHKGTVIGKLINDSNQKGNKSASFPVVSAALIAAMSIWWRNENSLLEPIKGHPSPTIESMLQHEDLDRDELDLNSLPVYSRYVFQF